MATKTATHVAHIRFVHIPKDGKDGESPIVYEWQTSPSQIRLNSDGTLYGAESVTVGVQCFRVVGTERTELAATGAGDLYQYAIQYKIAYEAGAGSWKTLPADMKIPVTTTVSENGSDLFPRIILRVVYTGKKEEGSKYYLNFMPNEYIIASAEYTVDYVCDGSQGASGPFVPPPMEWADYPDGYEFCDGVHPTQTMGERVTRRDVVLVKGVDAKGFEGYVPYACRVTHVKSNAHNPSTDHTLTTGLQNPYWEACDSGVYDIVATKVLLADSAYIDVLSSNGIRIYDKDSGEVVGEIKGTTNGGNSFAIWLGDGGKDNPHWGVDGNGTHFLGGPKDPNRIELVPSERQIRIFGDKKEVVTLDGTANDLAGLYGCTDNLVKDVSQLGANKTISDSTGTTGNWSGDNTCGLSLGTFVVGESGATILSKVSVELIANSFRPAESGSSTGTGQSGLTGKTYKSHIKTQLILVKQGQSEPVAQTSLDYDKNIIDAPDCAIANSNNKATKNTILELSNGGKSLSAGTYKLKLNVVMSKDSYGSRTAEAYVHINGIFQTLEAGSDPRALLNSNGITVANSTKDYMRAGRKDGQFIAEMCSGDVGFRVSKNGIQARDSAGIWRNLKLTFEE